MRIAIAKPKIVLINVILVFVKAFAEGFAGFEERQAFGFDLDGFAGAGVAADAGVAVLDRECAEAAEFDAVAIGEGGGDFIENGFDDLFDIAQEKMRIAFS